MSSYSVAKSEVIFAMIRDATTPVDHITQAWFSAAWTPDVLKSF